MSQKPGLYIMHDKEKGRGVFTAFQIKKGDVIEICNVIELQPFELPIIHKTTLHDFYFLWGPSQETCVLALGYGSLYNHAVQANAEYVLDLENKTIDFLAISDIAPGEEITVNYHGEDGDTTPLWWQKD